MALAKCNVMQADTIMMMVSAWVTSIYTNTVSISLTKGGLRIE